MRKNRRIALALTLAAGIVAGMAGSAIAEQPVRLLVNGAEVRTERAPIVVDGSVMVPVRAIAEALDKRVQWDGRRSEVSVGDRQELLAEYTKGDRKVELWGNKRDGGYWGMKMAFDNKTRTLPFWYNVGNLSYAPRVLLEDLNRDGRDELIVILTTGYGTGVKEEELHIFDSESFSEIPVEDWQTYALKHVKPGSITEEGARVAIDGVEMTVPHSIPAEEFQGDSPKWWYDSPAYGQVIRYEVRDGKLCAVLPLWFSPAQSDGQLEIRYAYKDGFFQGDRVSYAE